MQRGEWDGSALPRRHRGPPSRVPTGRRAPCTLTARRGLDAATGEAARRGKGNGHASGTPLQMGRPAAGWSREVRCKDSTLLWLWSPCVLSDAFPQLPASSALPRACHYRLSDLAPLTAPLSHAPCCPSPTRRNKDSRPLVIRHHPAGSKVIEVGHDYPVGSREVVLLPPGVRPAQPTQLALVLLRHPH